MDLKIGNSVELIYAIKDDNGNLITNLASMAQIKFMIKENADDLDAVALVSKILGAGVTADYPVTGYVRVIIDSADTIKTPALVPGEKYMAVQIEGATTKYEIDLKENKVITNKINLYEDVIR